MCYVPQLSKLSARTASCTKTYSLKTSSLETSLSKLLFSNLFGLETSSIKFSCLESLHLESFETRRYEARSFDAIRRNSKKLYPFLLREILCRRLELIVIDKFVRSKEFVITQEKGLLI